MFELLEQLRCETQTPPGMPGLVQNLRHRFEAWSQAFYRSGLAEDHLGILLYTVAQIAWSRLTGWPVLEETEGLIEATRAAIAPVLGVSLAGLRRHRAEQGAFAVHALELARLVAEMIRAARAEALDDAKTTRRRDDDKAPRTAFSLWFDVEDDEYKDMAVALTGKSRVLEASEQGYRAYTTRYDREIHAGHAGPQGVARRVSRAARRTHRRPGHQRGAARARAEGGAGDTATRWLVVR